MRLHLLLLGLATCSLASAGNIIVTGSGAGTPGLVNIDHNFDFNTGGLTHGSQFMPYGSSYMGGVRVAVGDIDGDGAPEVITGTMDLTSHIKVFDLAGTEKMSFLAYTPSFAGGVFVSAGDVDGDGLADIITGAGAGAASHVKAFKGTSGAELASFFAYDPSFLGGVRVAAGDVDGDGRADLVTATGAGGGPHVKVFNGLTLNPDASFFAYDPSFLGGVNVATGDVNGDGLADIITGAGATGGPHVKVFDGRNGAELRSFFAFDRSSTGGVNVAAGDLDGDGRAEIFAREDNASGFYRIFGDAGNSLGVYQSNAGSIAISSVPEPASFAAIAVGLALFARRRKSASR